MSERAEMLRRQAKETCETRTRELLDARTALMRQAEAAELGKAVLALAKQVTRLKRTTGVPFDFSPTGVAESVRSELAEVQRELVGSPAACLELGDLFATMMSLLRVHGAPLLTTVDGAEVKLRSRLDLVDKGATWDAAKLADRAVKRIHDCEIVEGYMPPHPRPDTVPTTVVRHKPSDMFLRYSQGPKHGHFWDVYGSDYLTRELAMGAIKWACANDNDWDGS